jgi:DNA-directed RNA polymerase specialized sigma24 family protein
MRGEQSDSLLMPYLQAQDEASSQRLLQQLIAAEAEPIINKIIGYKMRSTQRGSADEGPHEAEDVHGEVMVQLLQRLRNLKTRTDAKRLRQLVDDPRACGRDGSVTVDLSDASRSTELLTLIFHWVGGPVEIDDLVGIVAEWWGIKDREAYVASTDEDDETQSGEQFVDPRASVTIELERRLYLQKLWDEIEQLPARQRAALLLSLRDGLSLG